MLPTFTLYGGGGGGAGGFSIFIFVVYIYISVEQGGGKKEGEMEEEIRKNSVKGKEAAEVFLTDFLFVCLLYSRRQIVDLTRIFMTVGCTRYRYAAV